MDISKASNFERYVYDMVGRDPVRLCELWRQLDVRGEFDLSHSEFFKHVGQSGFVSDFSTHADRLATIRRVYKDLDVMVDTHTADGIKVAAGFREPGVPMICLETALPAKFAETIEEALGGSPERPVGFENIESLPQRVQVMAPDVAAVKAYVSGHSS